MYKCRDNYKYPPTTVASRTS